MSALESIKYYVSSIMGKNRKFRNASYSLHFTIPKKGFTLIELMVAISIVAIISSIGMVTYSNVQKLGRDAKRKQDLRSIAIALQLFYQKNKRYPAFNQDTSYNVCSGISGTSWTNLLPTDISKMPDDPINNGVHPTSANGYAYCYGWHSDIAKPQSYSLITRLENPQDKDRCELNQYLKWGTTSWCAGGGAANSLFVITPD